MKLTEIRKELNISQKDFCNKYHLNLRTYQNWEQQKSKTPKFVEDIINDLYEKEKVLISIKNTKINLHKPFKVCIENPFLNCENIHPLQQKKVYQIIEDIKDNKNVKKIIIFGSSVDYRCHQESDVDIYFELEQNKNPINKAYNFDYDYWDNFNVDNILKDEIYKTGEIVYER